MSTAQSAAGYDRASEMRAFLDLTAGRIPANMYWATWLNPGKTTTCFNNIDATVRFALNAVEDERNVYFQVGFADHTIPSGNRFKTEEVAGIFGFWADIDVAGDAHKKGKLPQSEDDALGVAFSTGLNPTIIVRSGHGLHIWWLFKRPWVFKDPEEREYAYNLSRKWQHSIKTRGLNRMQGHFNMDSTFDFARILRLPGTLNVKPGMDPADVSVMEINTDAFHELEDFITSIESTPPNLFGGGDDADAEFFKANYTEIKKMARGLVIDTNAVAPAEKLDTMLGISEKFRLTWDRKRPPDIDLGNDDSSYDMALLCCILSSVSDWTDQDLVNLIIEYRRRWAGKSADPVKSLKKSLRGDYLAMTIDKARKFTEKQQQTAQSLNTANDATQRMMAKRQGLHLLNGGAQGEAPAPAPASTDEAGDDEEVEAEVEELEFDERDFAPVPAPSPKSPPAQSQDGQRETQAEFNARMQRWHMQNFGGARAADAAEEAAAAPSSAAPTGATPKKNRKADDEDDGAPTLTFKAPTHPLTGDDEAEDRETALKGVRDALGVNIIGVQKLVATPPLYRLIVKDPLTGVDHGITLGEAQNLTNANTFRNVVAGYTQILVPRFKAPKWDIVAQALLAVATEESIGVEATQEGQMGYWLREYLARHPISRDWDIAPPENTAYEYAGKVHLRGEHFRFWLKEQMFESVSASAFGASMRAVGSEQVAVKITTISGAKTTKSAWRLPDNIVREVVGEPVSAS